MAEPPAAGSAVLAIIRAAWVHETQDLPPEAEAALWRLLVCARGDRFEIPADERAQAQVAKVDLRTWRRVRQALRRFLIEDGGVTRVHAQPFLAGFYVSPVVRMTAGITSTHAHPVFKDELHGCWGDPASAANGLDHDASAPSCESRGPQHDDASTKTDAEFQPGPASTAPAGESGPAMSHPTHPHTPLYSPPSLPRSPSTEDASACIHGITPGRYCPGCGVVGAARRVTDSRFAGWTSDRFFQWLYDHHPRPRYKRAAHRRWRHLEIPDGDTASFDRIAAELERWCAVTWIHCEPQHVKDLWGWLEERVWEDHE